MEKLLQEFYEANHRFIWFSEGSQIRKFSEWARKHGHKEELIFVDGKRNKVINWILNGLGISFAIALALGQETILMNFFPIGLIIFIFLPIFSKRTPTLVRADSGGSKDTPPVTPPL